MSKVFRIVVSNVRMPRSHSMTSGLPPARTYSAESSHSSIVAEMPRLTITGVRDLPSSRSSVKFCMLRAPTWRMCAYFAISSIWLRSMTSVISFRLWRSAAARRMRSPSSPMPWKLYGLLRGLKAPPRSTFAPARLTAAAAASTCSSLSAEHGPAITMTSSPPMRTSSIVMTVLSGLKLRLASL